MTIRGPWAIVALVCLVLSLAGNLFIAGIFVGRGLTGQPPPLQAQTQRSPIAAMMSGLPGEARAQVRAQLNAVRPDVARELGSLREARRAVVEGLRRPEIDQEALRRAMQDVRTSTSAAQEVVQEAVIRAAADIPADQRTRWNPRLGGEAP